MRTLSEFQKDIGYTFHRESWLRLAMTHPSAQSYYPNEFERLEFLGDRVLGLLMAEWVLKEYPKEKEGDLAKRHAVLVSRKVCDEIASELGIRDVLQFSLNDLVTRSSVLADTLEALIAALYLDGGLEAARRFVQMFWKEVFYQDSCPPRDPKTALQEWVQGQSQSLPDYREIERKGPDHAPIFIVEVTIFNGISAKGEGGSKRVAEKRAAEILMNKIKLKI